jgi:hypothetical protein
MESADFYLRDSPRPLKGSVWGRQGVAALSKFSSQAVEHSGRLIWLG